VTRISAGNPVYAKGASVYLRAVSGHRDTYQTSCPGNSVYAQLPAITRQIAATGLPKIYSPVVFGALGGNANRSLRSAALAASPRKGVTPKICWSVRNVELCV